MIGFYKLSYLFQCNGMDNTASHALMSGKAIDWSGAWSEGVSLVNSKGKAAMEFLYPAHFCWKTTAGVKQKKGYICDKPAGIYELDCF